MQAEGIFTSGGHGHGQRSSVGISAEVFRFKPGAESGIANLRPTVPEIRRQAALDQQMIEVQLNDGDALGEITANIVRAYVQTGYREASALRSNRHAYLLFRAWLNSVSFRCVAMRVTFSMNRDVYSSSETCREKGPIWEDSALPVQPSAELLWGRDCCCNALAGFTS